MGGLDAEQERVVRVDLEAAAPGDVQPVGIERAEVVGDAAASANVYAPSQLWSGKSYSSEPDRGDAIPEPILGEPAQQIGAADPGQIR